MPDNVPTDVTAIISCAVMTGAGAIINTLEVRRGQSVAVFEAINTAVEDLEHGRILGRSHSM